MIKSRFSVGICLPALTACASGQKAAMPTAALAATATEPNVVKVVATEYQFEMPDTLPAGPTLYQFTDNGTQLHHMTIVKFEQGKTLADFTALPPTRRPRLGPCSWVDRIRRHRGVARMRTS